MSFKIIFPETRTVSEAQVVGWAQDAVENGELDAEEVDILDPLSCITALDKAGIVTWDMEAGDGEDDDDDNDPHDDEEEGEDYGDESMDGDAESALTSAGWGVDESYGGGSDGEESFGSDEE